MNRIENFTKEKSIKQLFLANQTGKSFMFLNVYLQNRIHQNKGISNTITEILDVDAKELLISSK